MQAELGDPCEIKVARTIQLVLEVLEYEVQICWYLPYVQDALVIHCASPVVEFVAQQTMDNDASLNLQSPLESKLLGNEV